MEPVSLNGKWKCKPDIDNLEIENKWNIPENFNKSDNALVEIDIPKNFNLLDGFEKFERIFWYFYQFEFSWEKNANKYDYQIRFKGANYNTKIWLNGRFLGVYDGGFTPFFFDINSLIKEKNNFLVVRTENIRMQILDYSIRTINSKEYFAGCFIWNYRDFESAKRTFQYQQGFNRKGIVSGENNEKKLIYYKIPKILNEKRNVLNTKTIGIILWIVLFPFTFFIFTRLIDYFLKYFELRPDYLNQ